MDKAVDSGSEGTWFDPCLRLFNLLFFNDFGRIQEVPTFNPNFPMKNFLKKKFQEKIFPKKFFQKQFQEKKSQNNYQPALPKTWPERKVH